VVVRISWSGNRAVGRVFCFCTHICLLFKVMAGIDPRAEGNDHDKLIKTNKFS